MAKRMLIDAAHPEETRIVVLSGDRLDQFDVETSIKRQIKGNIYLAKVTSVEPSLQAAFVEYGGNRHGFLSFNEIHPDYYQIPIADREDERKREDVDEKRAARGADNEDDSPAENEGDSAAADEDGDEALDVVGGDDEIEDIERRRREPARRYRIQEVVKRRQILLVQVVKEERGNKGAALTTYISLAGRYCVLMPNAARGGGISRKIVDPEARKRLRAIASDLPLPDGIGVILRTAGMARTKAEIGRDFNYLVKLWSDIRERTLESIAPTLIYEEANLIKRSIRDLYSSDIEEILVEGEEGYRMAKDFMRALIPSHARHVHQYVDGSSLFHHYKVENQLDAIHSPTVQLKSGGYIVFSPTEALVAIDVNSGKATRERNIEETATKTNLEAAEEIARQLRLRDLSGLIVIDFIDMDEPKNVRTVERRIKEAMKSDRARIQLGRISQFGLLELSRQRLRPSVLEASSHVCAYCGGTGHVRSTESTALHVLRAIEDEAIRGRSSDVTVYVPGAVALYILNQKRRMLREIEERYNFEIFVESDDTLIPPDYRVERVKARAEAKETSEAAEADAREEQPTGKRRRRRARSRKDEVAETAPAGADEEAGDEQTAEGDEAGVGGDEPRKRRQRGKRGGRRRQRAAAGAGPAAPTDDEAGVAVSADTLSDEAASEAPVDTPEPAEAATPEAGAEESPEKAKKPRRRGRKAKEKAEAAEPEAEAPAKPPRARRTRRKQTEAEPQAAEPAAEEPTAEEPAATEPVAEAPVDLAAAPTDSEEPAIVVAKEAPEPGQPDGEPAGEERPKRPPRRGWWQRLVE